MMLIVICYSMIISFDGIQEKMSFSYIYNLQVYLMPMGSHSKALMCSKISVLYSHSLQIPPTEMASSSEFALK